MAGVYEHKADNEALDLVAEEIVGIALSLLGDYPLNRYNDLTIRADCLRHLRAAIELAPTLPPS